ncbi:hypothetical protein RIR_jg36183.t1 [Rhizophagus irregularis DAOM 181602=DAOM 197198]|nr:hypothetical protein RIR_jg36183.t1 [Rhizophagus irregularis DAOM 181602=DAOM 197198]
MDVTYPAPPTVLTDWKSIGAALEKVVEELALLTTQFASMNSRITNLESAMAARTPIPGTFVTKPPSYIPSSMQGWDDTRLSSLSDTVASLAGSIKEGIQQNNLILARQQGQANQ